MIAAAATRLTLDLNIVLGFALGMTLIVVGAVLFTVWLMMRRRP